MTGRRITVRLGSERIFSMSTGPDGVNSYELELHDALELARELVELCGYVRDGQSSKQSLTGLISSMNHKRGTPA